MWKVGRSQNADLFRLEQRRNSLDFVVDILVDASGSQRPRQENVTLQTYILAETLSRLHIPFRVMSFCTFWDYTILHRMRDYDDPREKNSNIFEYITSSNNRDGLAVKAAGMDLLKRQEDRKLLILLSDGAYGGAEDFRQGFRVCARYPQLFPYGGKLFKKKNRRINERNAPGGK